MCVHLQHYMCITKMSKNGSRKIYLGLEIQSQICLSYCILRMGIRNHNIRFTGPVILTDFKIRNEISQKP